MPDVTVKQIDEMEGINGVARRARARISFDTNAPCVLASERPSHPGSEHHSAKPS